MWTETMPAQPEIEAYLQLRRRPTGPAPRHRVRHRGRRDDLRRGRRGVGARDRHRARRFVAPFVVAASGILSVPLEPDIAGMDDLRRDVAVHQSLARRRDVDLTGKRVGVIGTGSTGVQLIPVVARQAGAPHGVPALARLHAAVGGPRVRARRARRAEGATTPRSARRSGSTRSARRGCQRLLGAARHAEPARRSSRRRATTNCAPSTRTASWARSTGATSSSTSRPTRWPPNSTARRSPAS